MRRAIALSALLLTGVVLFAAAVTAKEQIVSRINGIGLIDYSHKPTFKVGDWVRYRMTAESQMGMRDDYEVTLLIAGDEEFWGDRGFWIETWTDVKNGPPQTVATLMSYSIFNDSLPVQHLQLYQRKTISEFDRDGRAVQTVPKPASSMFASRTLFQKPIMWDVDTLEADTVSSPAGEFHARKISIRQGTGATATIGDSSRYDEVRENRVSWMDLAVPITHVAKETVENTITRRTWMIGRSTEGSPTLMRERGFGVARLVAYGNGLAARFVNVETGVLEPPARPASSKAPVRPAAPKRR
jgi:hypothetical protein